MNVIRRKVYMNIYILILRALTRHTWVNKAIPFFPSLW
jgi:hypothetical protein